jgi:hypothetical protein
MTTNTHGSTTSANITATGKICPTRNAIAGPAASGYCMQYYDGIEMHVCPATRPAGLRALRDNSPQTLAAGPITQQPQPSAPNMPTRELEFF